MRYPIKKIQKEIAKKEQRAGKKLSKIGRRKVAQRVIQRTKIRNRAIAMLAALGITVGGVQGLLTDGNNAHVLDNTKHIEMENEEISTINKKEAYLKELRFDVEQQPVENQQQEEKDIHIIDQILEAYNGNLLEQAEIDKDDLGIIKQMIVADGHMIRETSPEGEISYIEDYSKMKLEDNQEWVVGGAIDNTYILVDTKHNNTIAGIGSIRGELYEIDVEKVKAADNRTEYVKNEQTYPGLPENVELEEVYENFTNYFEERLENLQQAEKNEGMEI